MAPSISSPAFDFALDDPRTIDEHEGGWQYTGRNSGKYYGAGLRFTNLSCQNGSFPRQCTA
jgi:hypothetical protein